MRNSMRKVSFGTQTKLIQDQTLCQRKLVSCCLPKHWYWLQDISHDGNAPYAITLISCLNAKTHSHCMQNCNCVLAFLRLRNPSATNLQTSDRPPFSAAAKCVTRDFLPIMTNDSGEIGMRWRLARQLGGRQNACKRAGK